MAEKKTIRGRSVELQLLSSATAGGNPVPQIFDTVTAFTEGEVSTEDWQEFIGSQAAIPDKDVTGHAGTFDVELKGPELLRLTDLIERMQYENAQDIEVRLVVRYNFIGPRGRIYTRTHKEVVLKVTSNIASRSGKVKLSFSWRAPGRPIVAEMQAAA